MGRVLFTFLGGVGREGAGKYREARYQFRGRTEPIVTSYFAEALLQRLREEGRPADRVVVLGTAGSMWGGVAQTLGGFDLGAEEHFELIDCLYKAARTDSITKKLLSPLLAAAAKNLGLDVEFEVMPYCEHEDDAMCLVPALA